MNKEVLDEVKNVSAELKDLKSNITGKTATKMMAEIFPIKSEADMFKIQYNKENTENFELRLVNKIEHYPISLMTVYFIYRNFS